MNEPLKEEYDLYSDDQEMICIVVILQSVKRHLKTQDEIDRVLRFVTDRLNENKRG